MEKAQYTANDGLGSGLPVGKWASEGRNLFVTCELRNAVGVINFREFQ